MLFFRLESELATLRSQEHTIRRAAGKAEKSIKKSYENWREEQEKLTRENQILQDRVKEYQKYNN